MDADVRRAVSMSHLRGLPTAVLAELLAGAARVTIPAGSVIHREGENAPHLELVVSGVVRVFVTAPDGRTMTIRYCRSGALIGVMSLFAAGFTLPATIQALVDAEVLRLSPGGARRAADRGDAGVRARRTCRDRDAHRGRRAHAGRRARLDHAQVRLARIDGADAWRSFRSITLPLLSPVILFQVITGVIAALQMFLPLLLAADSTP